MLSLHQILLRVITLLVMPALLFAESGMAATRIDEPPSVTVRYHDLNLNSSEGVASLYRRIHAAAVDVCESAEGPQLVNRVFWKEWNSCVNHAVAAAVHAVNNEKLSAYHWERIRGWRKVATPITVVTR
jgi:UrcA family protein